MLPLRPTVACGVILVLSGTVAGAGPAPAEQVEAKELPKGHMRDSLERAVERYLEERRNPCERAEEEDRPCFPSEVVKRKPDASVMESLRVIEPSLSPSPSRPPTHDEMEPLRQGTPSPLGGASFDPVCAVKSLFKTIRGRNDTYFVYRFSDASGERLVLYDHELDPNRYASLPDVRYELVERVSGECDAVATYRRLLRQQRSERNEPDKEAPPER